MSKLWVLGWGGTLALAFGLGWMAAPGSLLKSEPAPTPRERYEALAAAHRAEDVTSVRQAALEGLGDPRTRADAATVLGWVGGPDDAALLWELSLDSDSAVADTAVRALGRIGGTESMDRLIQLARNREASTQAAAMEALGDIEHSDAFAVLQQALADPIMNHAAARGLARNGTPRAAQAVSEAFWAAPGWDGSAFASALADFPEASVARQTLWTAVEGERPPHFAQALDALAEVEDPALYDTLVALLDSPSTGTRVAAIDALESLGDKRAVEPLLARLDTATGEEITDLVSALVELGGASVEPELVDVMMTGPPETAGVVASWLFSPPAPEDTPLVVRIIRARPGPVAENLRYSLYAASWAPGHVPPAVLELAREEARTTSDRTWSEVLAVLMTGQHPQDIQLVEDLAFTGTRAQRRMAISALQADPSRDRDRMLLALLDDADVTIVEDAITALEERGPAAQQDLVDQLIRNLGRQAAGTGWGGAEYTLARLGGERGRYALLDQIRVGTGEERDNAISALVGSGTAEHHRALYDLVDEVDADARKRIVSSSMQSGNAPRDVVLDGLDDPDDEIATTALSALAESDGPAAAEALERVFADDERSVDVREAAMYALVEAGPVGIEDLLVDAVDDPDLSRTALNLLSELGTQGAGKAIASVAMDSDDPELREAALSSLTYSGTTSDEMGLFLGALDDPEESVRSAAISGLESLGTTAAAEHLLDIVREDPDNASEAAGALERLGGRLAVENQELITEAQDVQDEGWDLVDTGLSAD